MTDRYAFPVATVDFEGRDNADAIRQLADWLDTTPLDQLSLLTILPSACTDGRMVMTAVFDGPLR